MGWFWVNDGLDTGWTRASDGLTTGQLRVSYGLTTRQVTKEPRIRRGPPDAGQNSNIGNQIKRLGGDYEHQSRYTGKPGETIPVKAQDNVEVAEVLVSIRQLDGVALEAGKAARTAANCLDWTHVVQVEIPPGQIVV